MKSDDIIDNLIKKNDKLLLNNRKLKFNIFVRNIILSTSILANFYFIYKLRKN